MTSHRAQSLAPWSASKIQTALRCPRLFHYRYIDKIPEPETMPDTRIGKGVHKALEFALSGMLPELAIEEGLSEIEGPDEEDRYRRICQNISLYLSRIDSFRNERRVSRQFVEYRLAMDSEGKSTAFYAGNAYFRGVVDVAYSYNEGCIALIDHKTGMRQDNPNIAEQLEGYAVLAASYFRQIRKVILGIHWVSDAKVDWAAPLHPNDIQERLRPKTMANIEAAALAVADGPRPEESPWCLRCSYRSICPQAEKARFEPVEDEPDPGTS